MSASIMWWAWFWVDAAEEYFIFVQKIDRNHVGSQKKAFSFGIIHRFLNSPTNFIPKKANWVKENWKDIFFLFAVKIAGDESVEWSPNDELTIKLIILIIRACIYANVRILRIICLMHFSFSTNCYVKSTPLWFAPLEFANSFRVWHTWVGHVGGGGKLRFVCITL